MTHSKTYLNVPYAEKDAAKALGAKWDPATKKWFAPADTDLSAFSKWQTDSSPTTLSAKKPRPANSPAATTYPKDKNFIAYSGDLPPWD